MSTALKILDDSLFNFEVEAESEVFNLAKSYQRDINAGIKSIAIGSMGYKTSQQKVLLGIATYFALVKGRSTLIVTDLIDCGVYLDYINLATVTEYEGVKIHVVDRFNFISVDDVNKMDQASMKKLTSSYELTFIDVPDLVEIKKSPESYNNVLSLTEILSVVSFKNKNVLVESDEIFSYFEKFGIDLKGTLIEM